MIWKRSCCRTFLFVYRPYGASSTDVLKSPASKQAATAGTFAQYAERRPCEHRYKKRKRYDDLVRPERRVQYEQYGQQAQHAQYAHFARYTQYVRFVNQTAGKINGSRCVGIHICGLTRYKYLAFKSQHRETVCVRSTSRTKAYGCHVQQAHVLSQYSHILFA